ncbi:MAG: hypothetical protein AAF787_05545 [Chloroflexota bacterium]
MQLFRHVSPFNTFDATHPLLSYLIRDVRGGRTPAGLERYSQQALWVLGVLMFGGLALVIGIYEPVYPDDYYRYQAGLIYTIAAVGVSMVTFVIADLVTLFYVAHAVRAEINRELRFELLRTTTVNPEDYIASRLALGQVRAWRVYVVFIGLRWLAVVMAILMALWGLVLLLIVQAFTLADLLQPTVIFFIAFFTLAVVIFLVMLLWEPFWRFRMLTTLAGSLATRFRNGFVMWLLLAGAYLLVVGLQGMLASGVTTLGVAGYQGTEDLLYRFSDFRTDYVSQFALVAGTVPYAVMPLVVWFAQRTFTRWRLNVAERFIFMRRGDDR